MTGNAPAAATPHSQPGSGNGAVVGTLRAAIVGGRWLLVLSETLITLLLLRNGGQSSGSEYGVSFALLLASYNAASLVVVHRTPTASIPVIPLLTLDLIFVALGVYLTGESGTLFLGQCYLIILAAALFYRIKGGLIVGAASALLVGALALLTDTLSMRRAARDFAPYFLLDGAFTGYLSEQLRLWFRSYQESLAREKEQEIQAEVARREMEMARRIQLASLPHAPPKHEGFEIAVRFEYARQVGGDFHLFLPDTDRMGLALGDVSGKGVPAALMATTIAHLLPYLNPLEHPKAAIQRLNADLKAHLPEGAFVTLVLAVADSRRGTVCLWNAGHPPPLLWSQGDCRVMEAREYNLYLGFDSGWEGKEELYRFGPGDVLLLYSDGLTETRNDQGEQFDIGRVSGVLAQAASLSAQQITDALAQSVRKWGTPTDDLTVLVCKRIDVKKTLPEQSLVVRQAP